MTPRESAIAHAADYRNAIKSGKPSPVYNGPDLSGADLSGANLSWVDLSGANLSGANLSGANLSRADLPGADLSWVDLSWVDLSRADLSRADLSWVDLSGADLSGANLSWVDLSRADLSGANLPSPTVVLLAYWGAVSNDLTRDLMRYNAACHPDPTAFDRWAGGGACPYNGVKVGRAAHFKERRDLWSPGPSERPYDLMVRVLAEKCPPWTEEQRAEFDARFQKENR